MTDKKIVLAAGFEFGEASPNDTIDPVHGVHFLYDFYAILGVAEDASPREVARAIALMRARNHEDRTSQIDARAKQLTDALWSVAQRAEEALTDPEQRMVYDTTLAWFRTHRPLSIAVDERPVVCLEYFDLDMLRSDSPARKYTFEQAEQHAREDTNFDPVKHEARLQKLLKGDDPESLLQHWLVYWDYLNSLEMYLWMSAGFVTSGLTNSMAAIQSAEEYADLMEQQFKNCQEIISTAPVRAATLALEGVQSLPQTLLAPAEGVSPESTEPAAAEVTDLAIERFVGKATNNLEENKQTLREVAKLKAQTIQAIFDLTPYEHLNSWNEDMVQLFCVPGRQGKEVNLVKMALQYKPEDGTKLKFNHTAMGYTFEEIATATEGQLHIVKVPLIPGFPMTVGQLLSVAQRVMKEQGIAFDVPSEEG